MRASIASTLVVILVWCVLPASLPAQSSAAGGLVTPQEFAGFPIGSDGNLVRWENIVRYFNLTASKSERVLVEELGKTTNGNPFILATISAPENLRRLDQIKAAQWKIAHPGDLSEEEAGRLAWNSPAVVLITCNIHSTEIGSSQMALEVAHRMATEDSPWMRNVLDNVVFLLVPSFNPDGQIIVTDWNNRVRGTQHVWSSIPWLYHPYVGHDNNRDAFMMTQVESRYVNSVLFQDWFPQVYLDEHQQGNAGMRAFVPPFRNPINPNVDPVIWAEVGLMGFSMFTALHQAGFSGIAYDESYTGWWQGGFLRGAWFHNTVGLLTEIASANLASPVYQEKARLGVPPQGPPSRDEWTEKREEDPAAPAPAPRDVVPRNNYPRPWLGGKWTLRDIIDYELVLTYSLLEAAASNRVRLIENQINLGRKAIEQGKKGDPYAYLFPPGQHDPGAEYQLLESLHYTGIEIHRADKEFTADKKKYPAGTRVILMAQPFRAYAKDLLEPQEHPDPSDLPAGAMNDQPYDVTAWTLPLQMGVRTVRVREPFQAALTRLETIPDVRGKLSHADAPHGYLIRPEPNSKSLATNRLLKEGADVYWLREEFELDGSVYPPGTLWVKASPAGQVRAMVEELGLQGRGLSKPPPGPRLRLAQPRLAHYQPWTASMDEGWTRWLLEKYEFPFTTVHNADIRAGELRSKWDVIILPGDRGEKSILGGNERKSTPEEYRGGIGEEGREALQHFVAAGGALITMGDSTEFALRSFALPVKSGLEDLSRKEFSCPGSFLRILVDSRHPVAYGSPAEATAVFTNSAAFDLAPGFGYTGLNVIARYPGADLLQSGWMRGPEHLRHRIAAAEVAYRKGRVILLGFRPQFRAQAHNTFRLLFNAIHYAAAKEEL